MTIKASSVVPLLLLAACASEADPMGGCPDTQCETPVGSADSGGSDDAGESDPDDDDDDDDADDAEGGSDGTEAAGGIPCDVVDVLRDSCQGCHGAEPSFGAPMPLVEPLDFHLPASSDPARPVHEVVVERLLAEDKPMPPDGMMEDAARERLLEWLADGAPEDPTADCGDAPPDDGPDVGPDALPCEPDFTVTAHAGDGVTGFSVPEVGADNLYMCFAFKAPFASETQASAWAPIIDDERVVHHWILYRTDSPQIDGAAVPCDVTTQLTTDFVAGWAPGGGNMVMPDDVGLELGGPDDWYILQLHYNNTANYPDAVDGSGVAFCTVDEPRPQTAGVLTFGSIQIALPPNSEGVEVDGTCRSWNTWSWPELHVLGAGPHMHEYGRAMRTEIHRDGGGVDTLVDVPVFDFDSQGMYITDDDLVIHPGDSIETTCTYDNPTDDFVFFGEGTNDEMCFNFVMAYPIESISDRTCGILL